VGMWKSVVSISIISTLSPRQGMRERPIKVTV